MDDFAATFPRHLNHNQGAELQRPLTGTVTVVMVEGRKVMTLAREFTAEQFGALLVEFQGLFRDVLAATGGKSIESIADTVVAAFATPKQAALAAVAAQRAVAEHEWPFDLELNISVGLHSGEAGIGWIGPAASRCLDLCDAAEAGQIFLSQVTATLLDDEQLPGLTLRDLGTTQTRRRGTSVRAYELVDAP